MSRDAQRIMVGHRYNQLFPRTNLPESHRGAPLRNIDEWEVCDENGKSTGGYYKCAGVMGPLTGRGFDLGIIDDPVKDRLEADSETYRERLWDWYASVFFTRRMGTKARIVLMQTRWHEDDLSGRLLTAMEDGLGETWEILSLPAISGQDKQCEDDPREPGEALWPDLFDTDSLRELQLTIGPRDWSALYDQRPAPPEGSIFKADWFGRYWRDPVHDHILHRSDEPEENLDLGGMMRFATVDLAAREKDSADYTVICVWAYERFMDRLYLLEVIRARMDAPTTLDRVEDAVERHGLSVVLVESVAYQLAFVQFARKRNIPVRELETDRDKVARANAAAAKLVTKMCYLPRGATWLSDFLAELLSFPQATHDDQVDAFAYGVIALQMLLGNARTPPNVQPKQWGKPRRLMGS